MNPEGAGRPRSLAGWEQGLSILSTERWAPFLIDMGVPDVIAADPEPARNEARTFLRRALAPTPGARAGAEAVRRGWLREAIDRLAARHGQGPVEALALWVERVIADLGFGEWLAGWRQLVRIACGLATPEQPAPPLPAEIEAPVCATAGPFVDPAHQKATAAAIRAAARLPLDAWEQELEDLVQRRAGAAAAFGAVEMSGDLVTLVTANRGTLSALEALDRTLSPTERAALLAWAARQRAAAGLPPLTWEWRPSRRGQWLQPWAAAVSASEPFVIALDAALAEDAARRAGIDARQGFILLPGRAGTEIAFEADGSGRAQAILVAVSFGYDVAIAWRCAHHPGERLAPSDVLPAARGCRLSAFWIDLPADELRARFSGPLEPPFALTPRSFPVETWLLVWPDAWLEVQIAAPSSDQGTRLLRAFRDAAVAWNGEHPEAAIGAVGDPQPVRPGTWELFVSFGDEGPAALDAVLVFVDKALPGIARVVARSFPAGL